MKKRKRIAESRWFTAAIVATIIGGAKAYATFNLDNIPDAGFKVYMNGLAAKEARKVIKEALNP